MFGTCRAQRRDKLRTTLHIREVDDNLPRSQGNGDAGKHLGNPDIRFPEHTEREDGLDARGEGEEEKEQDADREKQETEDARRIGNNEVPPKTTGQPWEKKKVEPRALRHVPGETWLTKYAL
ncbi:hypothetical protein NDU88_007819 [Pleurodeles waltl]|uniref:Uncharacterized protein n=1 Tax=Pleurodeles waltl TaxID=8319 RepID=A0AAV7RVV8_PLEWA|nr:hypothetical protein NDU88_007819 [Pleurodeles waltl]